MTLLLLLMTFRYTKILHFAIMNINLRLHHIIDRSGFS